ncbi:hypothetical protein [Sphingopyxis sp.]|uniref:hypothetical protein n=1 Tax=Sphingopyxis sp. TaxID=1908224 RepID=UPI001DBEE2DE|nr:hypothetical protein [Sphingopyxis sp.]MBW8294358.1 hypothetical protein [Sphingopyxis sp.]
MPGPGKPCAKPKLSKWPPDIAAVSTVYTLRQAALILGETEDMVSEASIGMCSEGGCISISDDAFSDDDWAIATAFTDEGIEKLQYIIDAIKAARH